LYRYFEELRRKRAAAVDEVTAAEGELVIVKTSVEDAEAIYNSVRAQIAMPYHHGDDDDDEGDGGAVQVAFNSVDPYFESACFNP
jgi:hypothetical protein